MDAVEFIKAWNRMCRNYNGCFKCPLEGKECDCLCDIDADTIVPIVEQWAKEHPVKTRQSVFLKHYPEAKRSEDGVLTICPMAVSAAYRNEKGGCKTYSCVCDDCRRKFWMQEVE